MDNRNTAEVIDCNNRHLKVKMVVVLPRKKVAAADKQKLDNTSRINYCV